MSDQLKYRQKKEDEERIRKVSDMNANASRIETQILVVLLIGAVLLLVKGIFWNILGVLLLGLSVAMVIITGPKRTVTCPNCGYSNLRSEDGILDRCPKCQVHVKAT